MRKASQIRIVIADDHAILRSGLRMLIDAQPDMTVVGEAENGDEAVRVVTTLKPDVLILDITMPERGGLNAIREIARSTPEVRVLVLTMHEESAYLKTALAEGGAGYVLKRSVDAGLLSAIRTVFRGRVYIDSELAASILGDVLPQKTRENRNLSHVLSERELQVLKLVAEGFSSREIAEQIFVGVKTVETYRLRFNEKLGLRSRADVVRYALEIGLLSPEKFSDLKKRQGGHK